MDQSTVDDDEYSDCSEGNSSSSQISTSSNSTTSIKESARKHYESIKITTEIINLPKELCADKNVFDEFFSLETWHSLSDPIRKHLGLFLPLISDNNDIEKNSTIDSLFSNRMTRFGSCPLKRLQRMLEEGNCRPEISTLNKSIAKAGRREQRFQECERLTELARKVSISRESALRKLSNGTRHGRFLSDQRHVYSTESLHFSSANVLRAKKRYRQEITSIAEQLNLPDILSDDDKCSDATMNYIPRKQRRLFGNVQGGAASPGADVRIVNTLGSKDEQTTTGYLVGPNGKIFISDNHYRNLLVQHKRRKTAEPDHPELDCQEIRLKDVVSRTQASSGYRRIMPLPKINVMEDTLTAGEIMKYQMNMGNPALYPENSLSSSRKTPIVKQLMHDTIKSAKRTTLDTCNSDESFPLNNTAELDHTASKREVYIKTIPMDSEKEIDSCSIVGNLQEAENNNVSGQSVVLVADISNNTEVAGKTINVFKPINDTQVNDKLEYETNVPTGRSTPYEENLTITEGEDNQSTLLKMELKQNENPATDGKVFGQNNIQSMLSNTEPSNYEKSMPELIQDTHKCFLSLIRDMFCATPDHRLTIDELKLQLNIWLKTPIAALNEWYFQADDKWNDMLQSAILFLSGEFSNQPDDFVPYIEYKIQLNIYQWIGASRDSDFHLLDLSQYWLQRRHDMGIINLSKPMKATSVKQKYSSSNSSTTVEDDDGSSERTNSPPPPRYPTDWSVRKATEEEILSFRVQERRRYENPHMAFTYKHHTYNSVVGPVKGIYTQVPGISKARGHNMLVAERPNFVTILTLVRDATARLPNGEGTRADICELLKSSQYISPTATDQVLQTIVSGALDRMHTEHDPCVKYDTKKKTWIYLHRNRTEEEFERLHHQYQGVAKHKKPVYKKSKFKEALPPKKALSEPLIKSSSQSSMENDSLHSEPTPDMGSILTPSEEFPVSSILNKPSLPTVLTNGKISPIESNPPITHTEPMEESFTKNEADLNISPKTTVANEALPIRVTTSCKINSQPQLIARPFNSIHLSHKTDTVAALSISSKKFITATVPTKPVVMSSTPTTASSMCNVPSTIPIQKSVVSGESDRNVAHSFIVPVSLCAENIGSSRARLIPSSSQINISSPLNRVQSVSPNTMPVSAVKRATSLLQPKNSMSLLTQVSNATTKTTIQQPESFVLTANRQQKVACVSASDNGSLPNSSSILSKTDCKTSTSGAELINTITIPKGPQSVLTPAQQNQILQNLLAQQNKQVFATKSVTVGQSGCLGANTASIVNSSNFTTNTQSIQHIKGARQLQNIPAITLTSSSTRGTSTVFQTIGSSVVSPHVIQIKPAGNVLSGTGGTKIQPIAVTAKEQAQIKQLQSSLITKSAKLASKNDGQEINIVKSKNMNIAAEGFCSKASANLVQTAIPCTSITQIIKSSASASSGIRTINVCQGTPQNISKVTKNIAENQMFSLNGVSPRQQQITEATIRMADPKTMSTQLIHLPSSTPSGTPIAQYAVFPQNRTVAQSSEPCSSPTILTTTASRIADPRTTNMFTTSTVTSVSRTPATSDALRNQPEVCTNLIQSVETTKGQQHYVPQGVTKINGTPKILSANVRNGPSLINAPAINFATVGRNPLIITSKPAISPETDQHNGSNTVFQSTPASSEAANIVYGRQTVKVQRNIVPQGHVNIVNAQQGIDTSTQKLLLSNKIVQVKTVPRQPHQMQISFAQQPGANSGLGTNTGVTVVKTPKTVTEQQEKSTVSHISQKPAVITTPIKASQKIGVRFNQPTQRVVLATQGGQIVTQQIIVPQGFQGSAFNIKRLKVIPVTNQQKGSILRPQVVTMQHKPEASSMNNATSLSIGDSAVDGNKTQYDYFKGGPSSS